MVTTGQTAQQLAEIIAGPGVVVSNATITGSPLAIGAFTTGANPSGLGIASGVGLSNGEITDAAQPEFNFASTDLGTPGSAYLDNLTGENSGDAIILEFDFVPNADYVEFKYVFCSEEHPTFSCSNYVDPFAITIQGVSVPMAETNIALVPGTTTPIQITTINNAGCGNPNYYINNSGNQYLVYGGITTVMTASVNVQCGETYHLTFLQSDGGFDQSYDTSCFIEENSLTTGNVTIETASLGGDTAAIEGCANLEITLTLNGDPPTQDYPVPIWIGSGSTAQWGVDYDPISAINQADSTIVIPAGSSSVTFSIVPVNDNVPEGTESIELIAITSTCGTVDTFSLYIADLDALGVITSNDTTICQGNAITWATGTGGGGGYTYTWGQGFGVADTIYPAPSVTTIYSVEVTDGCGSTPVTDSVMVTVDGGPPAFAGNDVGVCAGGSVLLNASSTTPGCTFAWTPQTDLSNPNIYNPLCTPQADTEYVVRVTRSDGCYNDDTVEVVITPPPTADFILPNNGCVGDPLLVEYDGNANAAAQFLWDFDSGVVTNGSGIGPIAVLWNQPGTYDVELTVAWNGCVSTTETSQIEVLGAPPVNAGSDISFCSEGSGQIGSAPVGNVNYSWMPSIGVADPVASQTTVQLVNPTHTTQILYYTLMAEEQGCKSYDSVRITVLPKPTAEFLIPDGKCFTVNSFNLSAIGHFGSNATFGWDFGPVGYPASSTLQSPQGVIFNAPGLQSVSLVVEDNGCVSDTFVGQIDVFEMPDARFSADTINGCEPLLINFHDDSYNGGSSLYRTWSFGDGGSATGANPSHVYEMGVYTVRLDVVTAEGCADHLTKNGYIQAYEKPDALFAADPQVADIIDPNITFTNLAQGVTSSDFTFYPFNQTVNGMQVRFEYPDTGTYPVTQIVTTEYGCTDTISSTVKVEPHYTFYIPDAFTPGNDDINEVWIPQGESIMTFEMTIYNRWDQEIFYSSSLDYGWDGTFKGKKVPQGTYIYYINLYDILGEPHKYRGTFKLIR